MHPNQPNPYSGGPYSSPYPQQSPNNASGAYPQQQQQPPYGNPSAYGVRAGFGGGYQSNMSGPYGNNPYAPNTNPQGGNPYGPPGGFGMPGGNTSYPQSGYPPPSQHGNNPYGQPTAGGYGGGAGGYPPPQGGSGYPPSNPGYPGAGDYPPPGGTGYPGAQPGGYPGAQPGGYPGAQPGGYPGAQPGGYPGAPSGGYPGGQPGGFMPNDPRMQRLNQVIQQYEINRDFAARLQALANCEIVVLCDDSGSMNTPLQGTNQTRWDELKSIVNIVIDIASTMDANGVDVYFLNRDPVMNVSNIQTMRHVFNAPPQGLTPLVPALRRILQAKRSQTFEKKLLILIATDGAPTNEYGQTDIGSLEAVLRQERTPQTYVTFLACTDDLDSVNYLSNWDKSMPNLDVMDDYRSEKTEIQRNRGPTFPFSFGDYIVKALLGSLDPWFDSLDDRRF